MTDNFEKDIDVPSKEIIIDGMECRYWFRPNPTDYRKCSLRGQDDNCDEIKDCFVKELLGKLAHKEQELKQYKASKQASYEALQKRCNELELENRKLKQTLTEIKEIAGETGALAFDRYDDKVNQAMEQILNKINEVLDE